MFCPKCGTDNPDSGRFCRSCGTDLGTVSQALTGQLPAKATDRRGRNLSWESAITTFFMGLAFLVVSVILGVSGMGRGWWFWMLIPAFGMIGSSLAKFVQLKKLEQQGLASVVIDQKSLSAGRFGSSLPASQTDYVSPTAAPSFKTGDLVPPSVTDNTTRHLEMDNEGQTRTFPKE